MDPEARRVLQSMLEAGVRHVPVGVPAAATTDAPQRTPVDTAAAAEPEPATAVESAAPPRVAAPAMPAGVAPASAGDLAAATATLDEVARQVADCTSCKLCQGRNLAVPGEGAAYARVVFVGEGPGADEDRTGRPFVGRAGKLLDDIITKGMKRRREDVYICNVVKCRPPNNRDPEPDEVAACRGYLERQLLAIAPRVICALGASAARLLLETDRPLGRLRGRVTLWHGIPVIPTYHPAYLLRNPDAKRPTWEDIRKVMDLADAP
jgi:uracil-DNA glycosylase family 4